MYISNFNTDGKCISKLSLRLEFQMDETPNLVEKKNTTGLIHGSTQ